MKSISNVETFVQGFCHNILRKLGGQVPRTFVDQT